MEKTQSAKAFAKILVSFNEKGGSGKTTTSCQLGGALGLRGYDVVIADLDPSQAAAKWHALNRKKDFPATMWTGHLYEMNVATELEKLASKYDIIVVDCAPSVEIPATWASLLVADLAIVPTKVNPTDMTAIPAAKRLAKRAIEEAGRDFPVRVLPVGVKRHMVDDQASIQRLSNDPAFPLFLAPPVKPNKVGEPIMLGDRKAFTRSMLLGATAHAVKGGEDAVRELEQLTDAVLKTLGLPPNKKAADANKSTMEA